MSGAFVRSALRHGLKRSRPSSKVLPENARVAGLLAAPKPEPVTAIDAPPMPFACMP